MKRLERLGFLICWLSVAVLFCSLVAAQCFGSLSECIDATCRISVYEGPTSKAVGTGCVFEINDQYVYVLTNAHIAVAETAQCEFWRDGHKSSAFTGRVIQRQAGSSYDCAIVAVPVASFAGVLPQAIPVAPVSRLLRPGDTVTSAGCAGGAWATAWKGHVLGYQGTDLHFKPPPADGRSGSAIFDAEGEQIVGLLKARTMSGDTNGVATSLQALYRAFQAKAEIRDSIEPGHQLTQHRRDCPQGKCLPIFGGWRKSNPQPQSPKAPWPTLPGRVQPQPVAPLTPVAPRAPPADSKALESMADSTAKLSGAVMAYLDTQRKLAESAEVRRIEADAEAKIGPVINEVVKSGSIMGAFESGSLWSYLATAGFTAVAGLLGLPWLGRGIGRLVVRLVAGALGPAVFGWTKDAVVSWWKDDDDTPDEAKAKENMAAKTADEVVKKLNGNAPAK